MSHSHDQTLLQRMGFSDPDRRTPAHDKACVAIATDPERFIRRVRQRDAVTRINCHLEVPLQKGSGQYTTTIGFIDAVIEWRGPCQIGTAFGSYETIDGVTWGSLSMLVEVKTTIDSIGNLLRQMNLYREYRKCDEYVVFSLNKEDARFSELLKQQGYALLVRT